MVVIMAAISAAVDLEAVDLVEITSATAILVATASVAQAVMARSLWRLRRSKRRSLRWFNDLGGKRFGGNNAFRRR